MAAFILIAGVSAVFGGLLGWYFRGGIPLLLMIGLVISLCLQAGSILYFGPEIEMFSPNYLIEYAMYQAVPYVFLVLAPLIAAALLAHFARSKSKRK